MFDKYYDDELKKIIGDDVEFGKDANEQNYFNDCVMILANEAISKKITELTQKYNSATDNIEKREIIKEMAQLQQKLKSKNVKDKL